LDRPAQPRKGILFCLLAIGFLGFLHKDVDGIVADG